MQGVLDNSARRTSRGYTGHEHLDRTGFIHMNGRVYDPELGRFLSPDPLVTSPTNSQSWNRYSYVFNSPLSFTDPSGYSEEGLLCGTSASNERKCDESENVLVTGTLPDVDPRDVDCGAGLCLVGDAIEGFLTGLSGGEEEEEVECVSLGGGNCTATASGVKVIGRKDSCVEGNIQVCHAPADIAAGLVDHYWIKTENTEAGMGGDVGNPGEQYESLYVTMVKVTDHSGQSDKREGATCETVSGVCINKIEEQIKIGAPLGRFSLINNCQTFCQAVIHSSRTPTYEMQRLNNSLENMRNIN